MPKEPRRRQGSASIKASGKCVSCGETRSSQFHPAPQEWSDFYHCLQNVSPSSKKKTMRLCHSCYGSISKHFAGSALERAGPKNGDIAVVVTSKPIIKKSSIGGNGLFAERDYEEGEFVAAYGGRILSRDETEGKDQSYFKVIGVDKHNGIIDGKYDFGDALGRYINAPMKRKQPNCRWYKFNKETQTIPIKTNKAIKCGQEFTIRYSPHINKALHAKKKRGRPPNKK